MKGNKLKESLSLIERMDKHLTLNEAEQYILSDEYELMEYLWLKPNMTGLNVDIFVDDGGSYQRHNHCLLLLARNSYDHTSNSFIPFSIEAKPCVLDDDMEFNVSYDDIFNIQDFIQFNLKALVELANNKVDQVSFVNNIVSLKQKMVAENKEILMELATLRKADSNLPVDIWLDEGGITTGHAPRIKFRASNEQRTTREYSSMLLTDPPTIENFPKNSPLRKRDIDKIKQFVINNLPELLQLSKGEIEYLKDFFPNMKKG